MKTQNTPSSDIKTLSQPTRKELFNAFKDIGGEELYKSEQKIISERPLLQQAVVALKKMHMVDVSPYWQILIDDEPLQQAIIDLAMAGLQSIHFSRIDYLINNRTILPAITALKAMGETNLEDKWADFKKFELYNSIILLHELGVTNLQGKWSFISKEDDLIHIIIKKMHCGKEQLTNELWEKMATNSAVRPGLFWLKWMNASTLTDKIEMFVKPENKNLVEVIKLITWGDRDGSTLYWNEMNIDSKFHYIAANPELQKCILSLNTMGSKQLNAKWPHLLETKNTLLLKSIIALETMHAENIDSIWDILTTQELISEAILALEEMGLTYIDFFLNTLFSSDPNIRKTTCEAFIWLNKTGLRPDLAQWNKLLTINPNCILALRDMNLQDFPSKWEVLARNSSLEKCIFILKKSAIKEINPLWEALTQTPDLPNALLILDKWGTLNVEDHWELLEKNSLFRETVVNLEENGTHTFKQAITQLNALFNQSTLSESSQASSIFETKKDFTKDLFKENPVRENSDKPKTQAEFPVIDNSKTLDDLSSKKKLNVPSQNNQTQENINPGFESSKEKKLTKPVSSDKYPSKKTSKKPSCAYFALNALTFFAGVGGTLSIIAAVATFTLPPLLIGTGLIGLSLFSNHLTTLYSKKPKGQEININECVDRPDFALNQ